MSKGGRPFKVDPAMVKLRDYVEANDLRNLKNLLEEHGIEAHDSSKRTAVTWASFFGNLPILEWLLKNGASIDHQDKLGYCGLHYAVQEKRSDLAAELLRRGANPNLRDNHGNSPLWTALMNTKDDFGLIQRLLAAGAVADLPNKHGISASDLAVQMFGRQVTDLF